MCKESPALKQYVNLIEISIGSAMVFCRLLRNDENCCAIDRDNVR